MLLSTATIKQSSIYPGQLINRPKTTFFHNRRAWLFADTSQGANASATCYSLVETARANGIEPYTYMVEVPTKLPSSTTDDDLDRLLPWNQGEAIPV